VIPFMCQYSTQLLGNPAAQVRDATAAVAKELVHMASLQSEFIVTQRSVMKDVEAKLILPLGQTFTSLMASDSKKGLQYGKALVQVFDSSGPRLMALVYPTLVECTRLSLSVKGDTFDATTVGLFEHVWSAITTTRQFKPSAAALLDALTSQLESAAQLSKQERLVFISALSRLLFHNFTQCLSKLAVSQRLTTVTMQLLADTQVRARAQDLLATSIRLSFVEHGSFIIQQLMKQLAVSPDGQGGKFLLVCALCATLLGYPDSLPPHGTKILTKLASLATASQSEVTRLIRKSLLEWWRSHRDHWAALSASFTESQVADLTELFTTTSYYA